MFCSVVVTLRVLFSFVFCICFSVSAFASVFLLFSLSVVWAFKFIAFSSGKVCYDGSSVFIASLLSCLVAFGCCSVCFFIFPYLFLCVPFLRLHSGFIFVLCCVSLFLCGYCAP